MILDFFISRFTPRVVIFADVVPLTYRNRKGRHREARGIQLYGADCLRAFVLTYS